MKVDEVHVLIILRMRIEVVEDFILTESWAGIVCDSILSFLFLLERGRVEVCKSFNSPVIGLY